MSNPLSDSKPLEITIGGQQLPLDAGLLSTYGWLDLGASAPEPLTDYCARAQDRLIEQFEKKPNINNYLCALVKPIQTIEYVFDDLKTLRSIDTSTGLQLDFLGDLVGIRRKGLNDTEYRQAIRFQIAINNSNGEAETLISLTKFITGATNVKLTEQYPAGLVIQTDGADVDASTVQILEAAAPAGVKIGLTSSYGSPIPFAVAPDPGDVDPDPQGFSEPNYPPDAGLGGQLTEKFN